MENLTINQKIFIVKNDKIIKTEILALSRNSQEVDGAFALKGYDDRPTRFNTNGNDIEGSYLYAYSRYEKFMAFRSKQDAAKYQREKILEMNKEKRAAVTKAMNDLKEFRIKHHELLWTEDENKWIENFEREYNW